ncbi:MAG: hypothetical protein WBS24_18875 [Terriglobales bacterium]
MNVKSHEIVGVPGNAAEFATPLLSNLIDYAGLFPPAGLAMPSAVANYDAYLRSEFEWMLGRFIVPAARLSEFDESLTQLPDSRRAASEKQARWGLSVLLGADAVGDLARLSEYQARFAAGRSPFKVQIESVEARIATPEEITGISAMIPIELKAYFEIALSADVRDCIAAVAGCGRGAKIRTGGETSDKFPASSAVVEFIAQCAEANVPFKATAGLHHPLRSVHRLTYQPDSPSALMHGFLNVFLAAAFLRSGMEPKLAAELLEERNAEAFQFDSDEIGWRGRRLTWRDIAETRQHFALSFGSCSFMEPVDDLRALHLL